MNNSKRTRNALVSSVVALAICFSMFVGTTMAWFTDTATTGVNTIQAGTLDIVLLDAADKNIEGSVLEFVKPDGVTEKVLWEPGVTYKLPTVTLKNNGNLAVKYKLEVTGITNGSAKLLDVIDFTVKVGGVDTALDVYESTLAANEEKDITIEGTWTPSANDNKYMGEKIEAVALKVLATQQTSEHDSYGNQYDKDAAYEIADGVYKDETTGGLVVYDAAALSSVAKLANDDASITSVTLKTEEGEKDVPIVSGTSELTSAINSGSDAVVLKEGTYSIPAAATANKEVVIAGTKETVVDQSAAVITSANADITFSGVTIKGTTANYRGLQAGDVVYENCVFEGGNHLYSDSVTFKNCTFNLTSQYITTYGATEITFDGCTWNTDGKALLVFQDGSSVAQVVTVKNNTFNATQAAHTWNGIHVAAVSIDGSAPTTTGTFKVVFEGTNTVDSDFAGLVQIKGQKTPANVTVEGATPTPIA